MDARNRWADVSRLYHAALEQPAERRTAFLERGCFGDEALLREVESLLACHADAANFMAGGAAGAAVATPSLVGRQLGAYRIEAAIGSGGMGEVYRATDVRLRRPVAIKILPRHVRASEELRRQFDQEARAVAALAHPHICVLHDIGRDDTIEFLVLEHLEGETLAARLTRGPLSRDEVFRYAIQIADALVETHKRGIVHRDLKPANVMLTAAGAKLLDFGLATLQPGPDRNDADRTREPRGIPGIAGTLPYMAPEQLAGREADRRTDIFAFGAIVYEMVTGTRAFDGAIRPVQRGRGVKPRALRRIVVRCLALQPERRYPSMEPVTAILRHGERQLWRPPLSAASGAAVALLAMAVWFVGPMLSFANHTPFASAVTRLLAIASLAAAAYGRSAWRHRPTGATHRKPLYLPAVGSLLVATWAFWLTWVTYEAQPRVTPSPISASPPAMFENVRQLVDGETLDGTISMSHDGRHLAYVTRSRDAFALVFQSGRGDSVATVVRSETPIAQPRWSPDATRLAYITPAGAFVISAGGSAPQRIDRQIPRFAGLSSRLATPGSLTGAAWSPDGERLAITTGGSMFVVSLRDGSVHQAVAGYRNELHSCEWAPNGRAIACVAGYPLAMLTRVDSGSDPDAGPAAIVLIRPEGDDPRLLIPFVGANLSPVWSADSSQVYFVSDRDGRHDIYAAVVGGEAPGLRKARRLTVGLGARAVSMSANGRIAYLTRQEQTNIWAVPLRALGRASEPRPVTTGAQNVDALLATRDRTLRYAAARDGESGLFEVPLDGGPSELLSPGERSRLADWPPVEAWRPRGLSVISTPSPDGLTLAYIDPMKPGDGVRVIQNHESARPVHVPEATWPIAWTPGGDGLIYVSEGRVVRHDLASGSKLTLYAPRRDSSEPVPMSAAISADSTQLVLKGYHAGAGRLSFWLLPLPRPIPGADGAGGLKTETGGLPPPSFWLDPLPPGRPTLLFSTAPVPQPRTVLPGLTGGALDFAIAAGHLYFTRQERQGAIWIGDLVADAAPAP